MTLECNGLRGDWTFHQAEQRANYLLRMGRAVPPDQWVTGLAAQAQSDRNYAMLEGLG